MLSQRNAFLPHLLFLLALTVGTPGARAQATGPAPTPLHPSIRAYGEATASARPDQAEIQIGVVSQAATAEAAAAQNAKQLDAVLAQLRKTLGPGASIKSASYSLQPDYRYPREGGRPTITGYTARNIVQVKTGDLAAVGKVIDLATQSGANTIQSLQFTLKDEQDIRAQALKQAALKARANADAMAAALGLRIARVLSVDQGSPAVVRPMMYEAMGRAAAAAQAPPTPVEPGTVDVHATVTLTVEIAP